MDDLLITGNTLSSVNKFKEYLCSYFHMKYLGPLKYFLCIAIARNPFSIYLCQRKYALGIIAETGLLGAKLVSTLLELNHNLAKVSGSFFNHSDRYANCRQVDLFESYSCGTCLCCSYFGTVYVNSS